MRIKWTQRKEKNIRYETSSISSKYGVAMLYVFFESPMSYSEWLFDEQIPKRKDQRPDERKIGCGEEEQKCNPKIKTTRNKPWTRFTINHSIHHNQKNGALSMNNDASENNIGGI